MNYYLFLARSVTHAQDMAGILGKGGIGVKIRRASPGMTERGCGYSLEVSAEKYARALALLKSNGRAPVKVFHVTGSTRQEVAV